MPDKKISALTSLAQGDVAASTDVLPIVDTSATETKKITASALVGAGMTAGVTNVDINSGAIDGTTIGANSAAAGTFTNLTASGTVSFSGATVSNGGAVTTIDINGGTIDATSIGASSASTGAFTTLTTSSTVTLNGGTANGVLYLNGSKVATSGSLLTFDSSNRFIVGAASAAVGCPVEVVSNSSAQGIGIRGRASDAGGTLSFHANAAATEYARISSNDTSALIFGTGASGTEGFRLTSTSLYTASGINVGIGTSSPSKKLDIRANVLGESALVLISNDNTAGTGGSPTVASLEFASSGVAKASIAAAVYGNDWLSFRTGSNTERMRLTTSTLYTDSSINVGIGTSSPSTRLHVAGSSPVLAIDQSSGTTATLSYRNGNSEYASVFGNSSTGELRHTSGPSVAFGGFHTFYTDTAERARITAGGYSKFSNDGTYVSSTGSYHEFRNTDAAQPILYLTATSGSYTGQTIYINNTRAASSAYKFYSANANAVEQFYVRGDGVLYAQNTTIQSLSDGRLKENVRNATEGLDVVNALRPVRYDWKAGYGNDRKDQLGFIAQEVEAVFPDAVSEWSKAEGDDEPYKTVGPGALIPVLVKAIQELTARVAALESK